MRVSLPVRLLMMAVLAGPVSAAPAHATTFSVPDGVLSDPLVLVAYGDMRFTALSETDATSPGARQALVAKIAAENPAAIFLNGDLPWHGIASDYAEFRHETLAWRERHLRVYPALGNHEFSECLDSACLDRWWDTFPELRGRRWYSVAIGARVVGIDLDTDTSLLPGSAQPEGLCLQTPGIPRLAGRNTVVNRRRKRWQRHVLGPYSKTGRRRWDCCATQIGEAVRPERRDRQGRC